GGLRRRDEGLQEVAQDFSGLLLRFLAHGVAYGDFVRATAGLEDWSGWLDAWVVAGDDHRRVGDEAAARGRTRTGGDAYVRAALYYHFAKHQSVEDEAKYRATTDLSVATHRRGMTLLDPTFERIEIPFEKGR